jgi:hypothetical protein
MFKNLLQKISTKYLLSFFFFFYLSPIYANDFLLKYKCIVSTVGLQDNLEWSEAIINKIGLELEVDIINKKMLMKQIFPFPDERKILETDYKIISVKKNSLIAVSEELTYQLTEKPQVSTIILDNLIEDVTRPISVTYSYHSHLDREYITVQYGECL